MFGPDDRGPILNRTVQMVIRAHLTLPTPFCPYADAHASRKPHLSERGPPHELPGGIRGRSGTDDGQLEKPAQNIIDAD